MSIDIDTVFGTRNTGRPTIRGNSSRGQREDLVRAQFWMNVGYEASVEVEDGKVETRFISLAVGIPLDTIEELPVTSRNALYAATNGARNDLHKQIMAVCAKLAPGEERVLKGECGGLQIQLRRVNEASADATDPTNNGLIRRLNLTA